MSYPQCPRCGDNLSELEPSPRHDFLGDVCIVCVRELVAPAPAGAISEEVQKALARAASEAAFPRPHSRSPDSGIAAAATSGITILDYFAAKVAEGLVAKIGIPWHAENDDNQERVERAAKKFGEKCYALARGLLAARSASQIRPATKPE